MTIHPPIVAVGLDGTANSEAALRWAIAHAVRAGAALRLVHAAAVPAAEAVERLFDRAEIQARAAGVRSVHRSAVARPPGPLLVEFSEQVGLLVLGSRGKGARLGRRSDSVGRHLSKYARCTVVVVPPGSAEPTGRVVVQLRGSHDDRPALSFAFDQAAQTHSELEAVHAWQEPPRHDGQFSPLADDAVEQHWRQSEILIAEELAGFAASHPDVMVHRTSLPTAPHDALVWASAHADLLALPAPTVDGVLDDARDAVAHAILRHAHCPVAFAR